MWRHEIGKGDGMGRCHDTHGLTVFSGVLDPCVRSSLSSATEAGLDDDADFSLFYGPFKDLLSHSLIFMRLSLPLHINIIGGYGRSEAMFSLGDSALGFFAFAFLYAFGRRRFHVNPLLTSLERYRAEGEIGG